MSTFQSGSFVPPYTRKYTQHLARLQQTRASIDTKISSDPIELRSYGRKFTTPSADHSRSHHSDRTFGKPRPLSAGRGVFNPTRNSEGRPRSQSASSRGRSLSADKNRSRSRSRCLSASASSQQPFSRALSVARALIAEKRQHEQLQQLQSTYLQRLSSSQLQSTQSKEPKKWIPAMTVTRTAAPPPTLSSVISQKAWRRAPWPAFVPQELKTKVLNETNDIIISKQALTSPITTRKESVIDKEEWRQIELPRQSSRHIALTTRFIRPKPLQTDPHLQAPSYGVLVLPRHEFFAVELIKFVERQFNLPGQVTDIALAIRRQYSNDRLFLGCLSLDTHRLPDPLVIQEGEGDCEAVIYLGGTGYDPLGPSPFATSDDEDYDFDLKISNIRSSSVSNNNKSSSDHNVTNNTNNSNNSNSNQGSVEGIFLSSMAKDTAAFAAFSAASRRHPAERQASRRQERHQLTSSSSFHNGPAVPNVMDSKEKVRQEHHSLLHRFSEPINHQSLIHPQPEGDKQQQQEEEREQSLLEISKHLSSRTNSPPPLPATLSMISGRRGLTASDLRSTNNASSIDRVEQQAASPRPPSFLLHHEDNIAARYHHRRPQSPSSGTESDNNATNNEGTNGGKITAASVAAELKRLEKLYDRNQRRARSKVEDPPAPVIKRPVVEVPLHSRGAVAVEKHLQRIGSMNGLISPQRQQQQSKVAEELPVEQPAVSVSEPQPSVVVKHSEPEEEKEVEVVIEQHPRKVHEIFFDLRDLMGEAATSTGNNRSFSNSKARR